MSKTFSCMFSSSRFLVSGLISKPLIWNSFLINAVRPAESKKYRVPYRINPRKNTPRHTVIKLTKRQRTLKVTREKQQITLWEFPCKLSADFSAETLEARREWHEISKVMKGKKLQPRILYPARLLFRFDGNQKLYRQAKDKRIQHHQTSFATNAKGTYYFSRQKRQQLEMKNYKWKSSLVKANTP